MIPTWWAMDEALHSGYASGCKASRWRCTKAIARGVVQLLHGERRNATWTSLKNEQTLGRCGKSEIFSNMLHISIGLRHLVRDDFVPNLACWFSGILSLPRWGKSLWAHPGKWWLQVDTLPRSRAKDLTWPLVCHRFFKHPLWMRCESAWIRSLHSRYKVQGKASLKAVILHVQRLASDSLGIGASDCPQTDPRIMLCSECFVCHKDP